MRNAYLQMCEYGSRFRILKGGKISLVVSAFIASTTLLHASPSGGVVTAGSASIVQNGLVTNINQSTQKAAINWNNFSIANNEVVNFNQPNVSSITLNRVVGNEKSIIDGALNANGQVFILNSNGLLFSKNASINTAGLVATTMNLSDTDFMNGNYNFKGDSSASIINQGTITISDKGYVALFGKEVVNGGIIKATLGKVHLTGASEITLNLNGNSLVNLTVNKGVLDALVENKGAIYADGGEVYLTTNAVNELLKGVVNNTGIIEANTLDDVTGKIELYAHGGALHVSGTLEVKGGFIETSGKEFSIAQGTIVKAKQWLIDPVNVTIDDALATTLEGQLDSGDATVTTTGAGTDEGNINVNANISWSTDKTLTLSATNNINVNEDISHTGTSLGGIIFLYGQGTTDGGTSAYTVASGKTVTSPSLQWRKGSDLASIRYAIVDDMVYLGNKYIELGINKNGFFGTGVSDGDGGLDLVVKPSLFFGRNGELGIGMTGDADGFGTGADLRIDYFLPGSPFEAFSAGYNGTTTQSWNYEKNSVATVALLSLGADNILKAKVTSSVDDLEIVQNISLEKLDRYFKNEVILSNKGASDITNATFVRHFDPDNTVDVGGGYDTIQKIDLSMSSGDAMSVVSATSQTPDSYTDLSGGKQSKIIYVTTDDRAKVGLGGDFWDGTGDITSMINLASTQSKGTTVTDDTAMGIIFNAGSITAGNSKSFSYLTLLDNRSMAEILGIGTTPTRDITPIITQIVNENATTPHLPVFQMPRAEGRAPLMNFSQGGRAIELMSTPNAGNGEPTQLISMSDIRQMQRDGGGDNTEIRIQLSKGSLVDLLNGGVRLPENVEQEFFMAQR